MPDLMASFRIVDGYKTASLASKVRCLERDFEGKPQSQIAQLVFHHKLSFDLLRSAVVVKRAAAQIDVVVHSVGTLLALPEILEKDEVVESLSVGAGNTGRDFDLETNTRVAEFTFIDWKGGSEAIRKQKLFKDFFSLVESQTMKRKFLYVLGTDHALQVFDSRSNAWGLLRKFADVQREFEKKYGRDMYAFEYFRIKKDLISIVDIKSLSRSFTDAFDLKERKAAKA
jgi:hypothetical protein